MTSIDYQYVNIVLYNNPSDSNTQNDLPLSYTDTRAQPIIARGSDYECSVVRFSIPTSLMPLFVFLPNRWGVGNATQAIYRFQENDYLTAIATNGNNYPNQDPRQLYVYSSSFWIDFVNQQIKMKIDANAPTLIFDQSLNKLRWVAPVGSPYIANFGNAPTNYLVLTASFYNAFFSGFPAYHDVSTNTYRLWIINNSQSAVKAGTYGAPLDVALFALDDENFSSIVSWNTVRRLVVTTSQLQVNNESLVIYNKSQAQAVNILTDYEIPYNVNLPLSRAYAFYQPSIYRYSSIITDGPIQKIDINVYFENSIDQKLYQLYYPPNSDAYIKILFRRKKARVLEVDRRDQIGEEIVEQLESKR